ncbi:hypothetical protein DFH09DRAFT_158079 [Mycena vulgaris]|nr:hypothetical protein DFH09DRAFT_158079 [Mycena vulgaris]
MRSLVFLLLAPFHSAVCTVLLRGATMDLNQLQTLLTPEHDRLPEGTYIATGTPGVAQLAEYLIIHPETRITRLLMSDSTVQDMDTDYGYTSSASSSDFEVDNWGSRTRPPLTDEEEDKEEEIRHSNAKVHLKLKRAVRDIEAPLKRVLDKAAPSLEALTYLAYISGSESYDRYDGAIGERVDPRVTALLGRDYPSLTHFRFRNEHMDTAPSALQHPAHFPAITHLHLANFYPHFATPTLASLLDDFPRLTHLLMTGVGSMDSLPSELNPPYPVQGWTGFFKENIMRIPYKLPPLAIPGNLTVIIQPGLSPMLGDVGFCGTPGVLYDEMVGRLADEANPNVHLKIPIEEDFRSGQRSAPLRRAIAEFTDRAHGGEGEWAIPERIVPDRNEWWWNRRFNDAIPESREESEL